MPLCYCIALIESYICKRCLHDLIHHTLFFRSIFSLLKSELSFSLFESESQFCTSIFFFKYARNKISTYSYFAQRFNACANLIPTKHLAVRLTILNLKPRQKCCAHVICFFFFQQNQVAARTVARCSSSKCVICLFGACLFSADLNKFTYCSFSLHLFTPEGNRNRNIKTLFFPLSVWRELRTKCMYWASRMYNLPEIDKNDGKERERTKEKN